MKETTRLQKTLVSSHVLIQADVGVSLLFKGVDAITNETTKGLDHSSVRTAAL